MDLQIGVNMFFDLILLWLVNAFRGGNNRRRYVSDAESSENWIILDELGQTDFSFKDKMENMKTEQMRNEEMHSCDCDDFCDFDL